MGGKSKSHCRSRDFPVETVYYLECWQGRTSVYQSLSHDDRQKVMFTGSCDALLVYHVTGGGIL